MFLSYCNMEGSPSQLRVVLFVHVCVCVCVCWGGGGGGGGKNKQWVKKILKKVSIPV